jgi:hypothetical protein
VRFRDPFRYYPPRDDPPTFTLDRPWLLWIVWAIVTFGGFSLYAWLSGP